jgi:hypothetical protein
MNITPPPHKEHNRNVNGFCAHLFVGYLHDAVSYGQDEQRRMWLENNQTDEYARILEESIVVKFDVFSPG